MNTGQSNVEHNLRLIDNVINQIAHQFYKHKKNTEESKEKDEHLSMLAGKLGYLVNISMGGYLQSSGRSSADIRFNISMGGAKTWNYEERIIELEKAKNDPMYQTKKEYMFNPDIMLTIVRDNEGKIIHGK